MVRPSAHFEKNIALYDIYDAYPLYLYFATVRLIVQCVLCVCEFTVRLIVQCVLCVCEFTVYFLRSHRL